MKLTANQLKELVREAVLEEGLGTMYHKLASGGQSYEKLTPEDRETVDSYLWHIDIDEPQRAEWWNKLSAADKQTHMQKAKEYVQQSQAASAARKAKLEAETASRKEQEAAEAEERRQADVERERRTRQHIDIQQRTRAGEEAAAREKEQQRQAGLRGSFGYQSIGSARGSGSSPSGTRFYENLVFERVLAKLKNLSKKA